jgi:hypothetical protein
MSSRKVAPHGAAKPRKRGNITNPQEKIQRKLAL